MFMVFREIVTEGLEIVANRVLMRTVRVRQMLLLQILPTLIQLLVTHNIPLIETE